MPVYRGTVFGQDVSVLRDKGCSTIVVREDRFTGRRTTCILIDGTARRSPVASIDIVTHTDFKGTVKAGA
jgi:hypothetical protein